MLHRFRTIKKPLKNAFPSAASNYISHVLAAHFTVVWKIGLEPTWQNLFIFFFLLQNVFLCAAKLANIYRNKVPGLRGGTCQALAVQEKTCFMLCPKTLTPNCIFLESMSWRSLGFASLIKPVSEGCLSVQGKLRAPWKSHRWSRQEHTFGRCVTAAFRRVSIGFL